MKRILFISMMLGQYCVFSQEVIQTGFYKNIGMGFGYYHYGEVDITNTPVVRMDDAMYRIFGGLGSVNNGFKVDFALNANISIGVYTGSTLDVNNPKRNGQALNLPAANSFYETRFKLGYDILHPFNFDSTLYFQIGVGYYFNVDTLYQMTRLQGYAYIPIELEGEVKLSDNVAMNYMIGYNWFLFGNHFTQTSRGFFTQDYTAIQKGGYGINASLGFTFLHDDYTNTIKLVWEHWSIDAAKPKTLTSIATGTPTQADVYEPKNSTDIIVLQYSWGF